MSVQNDMGSGISSGTSQLQQFGAAADNATNSTTTLQSKVKLSGADFTRLGLGIGAAASGVLNLVRQYTGLQRAQVKVNSLAVRESQAIDSAQKAREKYNATVIEFGQNSSEAAEALDDLNRAEEKISVATQRHELAVTSLNQQIADFAISVVPSAIGIIAGLVQTFDILGTRFNLTGGALGRITGLFRLHRTETQLSTVANTQLALSNTQLTAGVAPLTGAIAANNAQMLVGRNSAVGMAAGFQTAGASARTASVGVRGLGISIKGALIATGIGAIIVGITTALEAFAHNWFGAADALNAFAQQVRAAFPALKPLFDILEKIWFFIMKVFGGEVPGAMDETGAAMEDAATSANTLNDAIKELNQSSAEFVLNLAAMEKKEMKGALFDLGIKGGAEKRFKGVLKDIDNIQQKIIGFSNAMQTLRQIDIWEKLGLKGIPNIAKKIFFTFEDRFDEISEMFKKGSLGKKIFNGLEETMRLAAKNPGQGPEIIAKYLANHPQIIKMLQQMGFTEEAKFLQTQADEAVKGALNLPKVNQQQKDQFLKDIGMEPKQDVLTQMKTAFDNFINTDLPTFVTKLTGIDFSGVAATWQKGLLDPIIGALQVLPSTFSAWATQAAGAFLLMWNTGIGWIEQFVGWVDATFPNVMPTIQAWGTAAAAFFMLGIASFQELGNLIYKWIDAHVGGQLTNLIETGKKIGASLWEGIKQFFSLQNLMNLSTSTGLTLGGVMLGNPPAFGDTGTPPPTVGGSGVNKAPATTEWVTWQQTVEEKIGFVWTKITAFTNYINTAFTSTIPVALQISQTAFTNLANQGANSLNILASASSTAMSGFSANLSVGEVAAQDLQTGIANLSNEGIKSMKALAKASSTMANGIKNNMVVAVKAVNSLKNAISSLKSKTVTVSVKVSGAAKGGLMTFAGGGLMSAAGGTMFTANGQQQVTVGDNPGGRETVAFIPHNDPGPTLEKIARMFGSFGDSRTGVRVNSGGGSSGSSGPMIIQVFLDGQQVKGAVVKMISVNSGGFK